jgi:hypothetical protein
MVININPNRINVSSGKAGRTGDRKPQQNDDESLYTAPRRSDVNYIPEPASLATLISSAIAAMRRGVYWDRGTIINLYV